MSTLISLVLVAGCVAATAWLVMHEGGQPATDAPPRHRVRDWWSARRAKVAKRRAQRDERRRAQAEERAAAAAAAAKVAADARPAVLEEAAPTEGPAPQPPPDTIPAPATTTVAVRDRPAPTSPPGPRRGRVRAPEPVKGRRRDLGRRPATTAERVLVPSVQVPPPESARTPLLRRFGSGIGLVVLVLVLGVIVAAFVGVLVLAIGDLLQQAVE